MTDADPLAPHGWRSTFPEFERAPARVVRARLQDFIPDASPQQLRAWDDSIPKLQTEVREVLEGESDAGRYTAILEYELPLDARRPDVILLVRGAIVVLELKGKSLATQADVDQAAAYARDLRGYHRSCAGRDVHAIVVPTAARGYLEVRSGVHVAGPDALDALVRRLQPPWPRDVIAAEEFLRSDAYCPLPTLVQAARELFRSGRLRRIERASAATDPAVEEIAGIVHEAAATRTRRLVLLTGVPGSGKTLVGLRIAHAHFLDDLAVPRPGGKPTAPAVFLSGNGPLVEVLQYELREAGGCGRTFVRDVKSYVRQYSRGRSRIPPEHVLVFDEAQRAWDRERVEEKHSHEGAQGKSEPEHFVEFSMRIPEWCVVVGLIGGGQEINVGEEAGLVQWRHAVEGCGNPAAWAVHGPANVLAAFDGSEVARRVSPRLDLDVEIRFHLSRDVDAWVERLLAGDAVSCRALAGRLESDGYHLRITRDDAAARKYLQERYRENPLARFGVLASSRDKDLVRFGIGNDYAATRNLRYGPWYGEGIDGPFSCRHLRDVVTEFGAQGLELDAVLLAWGTDLVRENGGWSTARARGYKRGAKVKDPFQLRLNAYRVLLTRGRDGTVVFVPPLEGLDETARYLESCGFRMLAGDGG
jgi:hypothetical protein